MPLNKISKIAQITTPEAYSRLEEWHYKELHKTIYENNNGRGISAVAYSYYTNTKDRFYLSKWLEAVIKTYLKWCGWTIIQKSDKGIKIKTKAGKEIFVKTKLTVKGQADVIAKRPLDSGYGTLILNIEIKIGNDKQSDEQFTEHERCKRDGELYHVVKTLDDFWNLADDLELNKMTKKN